MYEYRAVVNDVIDGDTVDLTVSLGFHMTFSSRFRLYGINTPESYGAEASDAGRNAKERVKALLPKGASVMLRTERDKTEKYGRYLGTIFCLDDKGAVKTASVNDLLIAEGHAKAYLGKGVKPV